MIHGWIELALAFAIGWGACCAWIFACEWLDDRRLTLALRRRGDSDGPLDDPRPAQIWNAPVSIHRRGDTA